jgi:hypothetical protein
MTFCTALNKNVINCGVVNIYVTFLTCFENFENTEVTTQYISGITEKLG